jgi:hypothetical protein
MFNSEQQEQLCAVRNEPYVLGMVVREEFIGYHTLIIRRTPDFYYRIDVYLSESEIIGFPDIENNAVNITLHEVIVVNSKGARSFVK